MIQSVNSEKPKLPDADTRPTVCHVIHALGVGGAEVLVDQMVRRLSGDYRCVVAVLDAVGQIGAQLRADGFVVEHLRRQSGIDVRCAARLNAFVKREGVDLLHAHQCTPFFQAMLSRGATGTTPVLLTEHGRHFPDNPSRKSRLVNRLLLRRCDRLFGCGKSVQQALIDNEGLPAGRVGVIYNGVDLEALAAASSDARPRIRREFGFRDDDFVAVQVARLHELKDHRTALEAINIAKRSVPTIRLLLVGAGDERSAIEGRIFDLGLANHVKLAGSRNDVRDLLAASDAFLMSSISEGIPLTIIEAMAAGLPVVSTAVGGIPEMIADELSGFLAGPGDAPGLARGLVRLAEDPQLRKRLIENGRHRAHEQFSLTSMLDNYRRVYQEMLEPRRTVSKPRRRPASNVAEPVTPARAEQPRRRAERKPVVEQSPASLVVFSDDWGRHPSSCQHLIRQLLPKYKVLWVNTIGTRAPRLDLVTVRRVAEKLAQWRRRTATSGGDSSAGDSSTGGSAGDEAAHGNLATHCNLQVVNPRMWPWFGRPFDRALNRRLLTKQLAPLIRQLPQPVHAVTTIPITADLPESLPVSHWTYYCVDDFAVWPGLDGDTLRRMDAEMIRHADSILAVSETLRNAIAQHGRSATLLTHGVDLAHWQQTGDDLKESAIPKDVRRPLAVFWGMVDRRLDSDMLKRLSQWLSEGTIVLMGPQQDPDPAILELRNVMSLPAQSFQSLPRIAHDADVLIMPYADLPVTRAMQPLKLKEYMATGKPVVVSRLPAVGEWSDCIDIAQTAEEFASAVQLRSITGLPAEQLHARERLVDESWAAKSEVFERILTANRSGRDETAPAEGRV
ncbi:MAG: glycosyltransferase [Planctomycetaceae bacterium]